MKILKAEVRESFDPTMNGGFFAKIDTLGDASKFIKWSSPYATGTVGGFSAPTPVEGTRVLVVQPDECDDWYFFACLNEASDNLTDDQDASILADIPPLAIGKDITGELKGGTGLNEDFTIGNHLGAQLELSQTRGAKSQVVHAKVESPLGKKLLLSDSPGIDSVILDSNNGSKITLTSQPQSSKGLAARSVQVETVGPQKYINAESQTDIVVVDGRELQLINNSTGSQKNPGRPDHYGNVNIQSKWKDVNIFTKAEEGRIFIECLKESGDNQVIEIQTHGVGGAIRILTNGKVDIAATNISIEATSDVNVASGGDINLGANGSINLRAGGNINQDGTQIHLNSGQAIPPNTDIGDDENYYGNKGITTY